MKKETIISVLIAILIGVVIGQFFVYTTDVKDVTIHIGHDPDHESCPHSSDGTDAGVPDAGQITQMEFEPHEFHSLR